MKRNIVANIAGSLWGLLLSLAAIPLQIRLLGAEAYGLIGFITSLQVILVVLDFGLSTSVVREIAGDKCETRQNGREVAQVGATVYWIVALAVGAIVFLAADPIAHRCLTVESLTPEYTTVAVRIMAVYLTLTWPIGHYANVLFGLNRLVLANNERLEDGKQNPYKGTITVVCDARLTSDTAWFLLDTAKAIKPFIYQERKAPVFVEQTDMSGDNVFMRKKYRYGAEARAAGGYGFWQLAYGSTGLGA